MSKILPNQIVLHPNRYSNITGTANSQIASITSQITDKNAQKRIVDDKLSKAQAEKARLEALKDYDTNYYKQYANANNWTAAYFHSDRLNNETLPALASVNAAIDGYKDEVKALKDEIGELIGILQSIKNTTPEQQAEIERLAKESEYTGKNKKYIIIGVIALTLAAIIGTIIIKVKRARKA